MIPRADDFPTTNLALQQPVTIRWNAHVVPYIEARTDADAAYALGLVHAHLRSAQLQLMMRLAQGRLSEMLGPLTVEVDHALRILGLPRAAALAEAGLAATTRVWIDDFVRGLNDYQAGRPRRPREFAWLGIEAEPFTRHDILTIGRLAGADVSWFVYLGAIRARSKPGFAELWQRMLDAGGGLPQGAATSLIGQAARFGSNSVAIASSRSASGAPLLANDPHLGQMLPNFWILAGLHSPSYRMVGLMPPGLPFVGVGASEGGAWGGTNMHAASSDVVDVSSLKPDGFETETVRIGVRLLGSRARKVRLSAHGPLISDARVLKPRDGADMALRWAGYAPSDEIGAFLAAARAGSADEFHRAFENFAVSAQNMVFATRKGEIGKIHAARLPQRDGFQHGPVLAPHHADDSWRSPLNAASLPLLVDPPEGYIVSANERPAFDRPVLGFWYSDAGRAERLAELAGAGSGMNLAQLAAMQRDTRSPTAARMAARMVELFAADGVGGRGIDALRGWSGDYAEDSAAAVAFEAILYVLAEGMKRQASDAAARFQREWAYLNRFLLPDVARLPAARRRRLLIDADRQAQARLRRFPSWGDQHRLRIAHVLRALPLFGRLFEIADLPVGGSRDTPMKTAHGLVEGRHHSTYGAQARHLSDLDANHFVLLGGNDGWWGSSQLADQVDLWRRGGYIRMPLRPQTVAAEFTAVLRLEPATATRG
ncbi:MAG: penicillin acylase family protein [Nevskia sp.]|nr:penicillin acylase family protein [Nevskia sp.]